jgi:death-on-curing protein
MGSLEPTFLTRDEILRIHRRMINRYSESTRSYDDNLWIRDDVLLESALFAPQASFGGEFLCKSVAAMAGAYWHSFTINHPFEDGNKRVALTACSVFLRLNGFVLTLSQKEAEQVTLQMASGEMTRDEVISLAERSVAPIPGSEPEQAKV